MQYLTRYLPSDRQCSISQATIKERKKKPYKLHSLNTVIKKGCRNPFREGKGGPIGKKKDCQHNKENLTVRFGFRGGRNTTGRPDKNLTAPKSHKEEKEMNDQSCSML